MYGDLTDKETVTRLEFTLENQQQDQFEILLYKKNSKLDESGLNHLCMFYLFIWKTKLRQSNEIV